MRLTSLVLLLLAVSTLCIASTMAYEEKILVNGQFHTLDPEVPALYQYISIEDDAFSWNEMSNLNDTETKVMIYTLNMTSLKWLTPQDSNRHVWYHTLNIVVPWGITNRGVFALYITGCTQESTDCPKKELDTYKNLATMIGAPLAVLTQIPNSRVIFNNDPLQKSRGEDAIVAYTWKMVLENPTRPDWLLYLPMAKAARAAVTAVEQWSVKKVQDKVLPEILTQVFPVGASKRGATTWLLGTYMGAAEPHKIVGMAPLVFDVLNFTNTIQNMYQSLGAFSFALQDYIDNDLIPHFNDPESMIPLLKHIDLLTPWYRDGLSAVPKLVVSAIGDEFFWPTNDRFYWDNLPGPKSRLMIPGAEHSMATGVHYAFIGVSGFFRGIVEKTQIVPTTKWSIDYKAQTITYWAFPKPLSVGLFKGLAPPSTPPRADFRMIKSNVPGGCQSPAFPLDDLCVNPTEYIATEIPGIYEKDTQFYKYQFTLNETIPQDRWLAMFFVASWNDTTANIPPQVQSSGVAVLPDVYPFETCFGVGGDCNLDTV